jgi:NAD+ synthase (glutamine-hydrolysing)
MRIALAQLDLTVGALRQNRAKIADACADAARQGADLVLAPELALSGYPPEDLVLRPSFLAACARELEALAAEAAAPLLVGLPVLDGDRPRNAAALCVGGAVVARYDKRLLPNYGVFDETRTFAPGRKALALDARGALVAITICEDIWLPGPSEAAAAAGATVIANLSASPYHLGKGESREQMLRTRARDGVAFVAFCNIVGGQDELIFDGRSCVIDPQGEVIARAATFAEELLVCDIDPGLAIAARLRDARLRNGRRRPPKRLVPVSSIAGAAAAPGDRLESRVAEPPSLPNEELWGALCLGLRDYVHKNGFGRVLIGMSGGIDSALVAALAAEALGPEFVEAISMPTRFNASETRNDARDAAERLGVGFRELAIEELRLSFAAALPEAAGLAAENLQARIRGVLLMTLSNQHGWLVLTTGNKSETATGYSTLYGDTAGGFAPIRDVPKTVVFALARWLNERAGRELIPSSIIERPPSAELRDDQRDDQSLPPYDELDPVLEAYVEDDRSPDEIADAGIGDLELAVRVARLVDLAEYKRRQAPPGLKLHPKSFGKDRRVPITNRFLQNGKESQNGDDQPTK